MPPSASAGRRANAGVLQQRRTFELSACHEISLPCRMQSVHLCKEPGGGIPRPDGGLGNYGVQVGDYSGAHNTQVVFTWSVPANTGGSTITGYIVYDGTSTGNELATTSSGTTPITATSYTVTGLTIGPTYYFTVKPTNALGDSAASSEMSATPATPATMPTAGYWLVAYDVGIFSCGGCRSFYGTTGAMTLNKPIVGMGATQDRGSAVAIGWGCWLWPTAMI